MANTELSTVEDTSQLPAYLQGQRATNEDNFDSSDVVIPRIKLLQGTSDEIAAYNDAASGNFWHTGMDLSFGTTFRFVVADRRKKYLLMAPMQDGQGILARSDDAKTWDRTGSWQIKLKNIKQPVTWEIKDRDVEKSGLTQWGTYNPADEDSPPAATLFYDYLIFMPDRLDLGPAVMSIARTAVKKARKGLNDKIKMQGDAGRPMQSLIFTAKVVPDVADGQDFWNWQFQSAGFVQNAEHYNMFREYVGSLSRFKIQQEADTGEGTNPNDGADEVPF